MEKDKKKTVAERGFNKEKADAVAKSNREKGNSKQDAKRRARTKIRHAQSRRAAHKATTPKQNKVEPDKTKSS